MKFVPEQKSLEEKGQAWRTIYPVRNKLEPEYIRRRHSLPSSLSLVRDFCFTFPKAFYALFLNLNIVCFFKIHDQVYCYTYKRGIGIVP